MRARVHGLLVGVVAVLGLLIAASPAQAHAELESSDPADGQTLSAPPTAVSFTFGEELLDQGNAITLTVVDTDARLALGAVEVDGDTVRAAWPEQSPAGEFRAAYRVVSADGHPIQGSITFTVTSAAGDANASPAATQPTSVATPEATNAATSATTESSGSGSAWLIGLVAVLLIAVGVIAWRRRR